eukprot:m.270142 g.270142  ORF g.270142 m.270142 type:complete len:98 (+) comp19311_c0_seq1:355-648(+)
MTPHLVVSSQRKSGRTWASASDTSRLGMVAIVAPALTHVRKKSPQPLLGFEIAEELKHVVQHNNISALDEIGVVYHVPFHDLKGTVTFPLCQLKVRC